MKSSSKLTQSVHAGSPGDPLYGGVVNPIYVSSAYDYEETVRYPRYYNTPNQTAVAEKITALENGQDGLVFSSGMAAIMTSLFAMVKAGDHIIFQNDLYGGTHHAALYELNRYGITYTMVDATDPSNFEKAIRKETKVIYIETPSNPLLKITDIKKVASIARKHKLVTIIDNTFASPVNQNPIDLGIDIVTHSGTKYIGGHSDLCCGLMVSSKKLTNKIKASAMHFGGSLDAQTCYLVERSLKTIVLRVNQQNSNAMTIARFLESENKVGKVFYPGLKTHPLHSIAKKQMPGGFGGMLSFEVKGSPDKFMKKLKYIKRAVSLGGVESTINSPMRTSHSKLTAEERKAVGISDKLVRFSVGIEDPTDLINDIKQAL
ncbi:MAG TPA: PLP-dependent aspartate aminotransferase family protein [Cyclobacteriaceae bacterium]|nr:PLP-dependent aspartate aminotransferase family protein [Cyclobacteriaceae bacterium]